jgi:hypothetical protein
MILHGTLTARNSVAMQLHRRLNSKHIKVLFLWITTLAFEGHSQNADARTALDDAPFTLVRSSAVSGANTSSTVGLESVYQNPAAIGSTPGFTPPGAIRQLQFPFAAISVNANTRELRNDFSTQGGASHSAIGQAIVNAHAGRRQFARASIVPNIVMQRVAVVPFLDQQLAAVPTNQDDLVDVQSRTTAGFGVGSSVSDEGERLSLGVFLSHVQTTEIKGMVPYADMVVADRRSQALSDLTRRYSGVRSNIGLQYRPRKDDLLTFAVVARDVGQSTLSSSNSDDTLVFKENLGIGMTFQPKSRANFSYLVTIQADALTQMDLAVIRKPRLAAEVFYSLDGRRPLLSLSAGASYAGASLGMNLDFGLLAFQISSYATDVGIGNNRLIERRMDFAATVELVEL